MRTPPLPADYLCQGLQTNLRKTLDTTGGDGKAIETQNKKQLLSQLLFVLVETTELEGDRSNTGGFSPIPVRVK